MRHITLDEVIDVAMQLPDDQRELLVSILQKRQIEARRHKIAVDAQESIADFRKGKLKVQTAEDAIDELHQGLEEDE